MQRIVCHGDSLTEGADVDIQLRWPSLLQTALDVEVINTGIGGDSTAGMLSRFPTDVVRQKPSAVILLGGTNDFWWDLSLKTSISNLFTMAYQAQYYGIVPLFGLALPVDVHQAQNQSDSGPEAGYERLIEKIEQLNSRLKALAQADDITLINFYDLFLTEAGNVRTEYYLEDGVHPNQNGHQQMAELAVSILRSSSILNPEPEEILT
jgi:lysophospholipase L1-like esterase